MHSARRHGLRKLVRAKAADAAAPGRRGGVATAGAIRETTGRRRVRLRTVRSANNVVNRAATVESLRTAAQQESAHTINEIGTQIDHETSRTMAAIGAAADRQIVEMLERHADDVNKRRATQTDIARADAEFAKRFAEVAQKFIEDAYADVAPGGPAEDE